ncbi:high mobility group protein [Lodderomyces elongisporus]|uniref:high mobility group protein n=1 Tax=Lodderomyces elongisporus TaxID=36914 RepID=UPI002924306B|nr:high mobility group protein [Lodderomyces elongisporus]WLF78979.1 high mobility group protein [Lodderomyces elongisporus]
MSSELKITKDTLVASLFELSKAASEAANAAIDFYKVATGGEEDVTAEQLHEIQEAMKVAAQATAGVKRELEEPNGETSKKKKKAEKDPNAPKKPLTMYFAYSFDIRKRVAEERKKKNLPNMNAIDMNQTIKDHWESISPEEKAKWKNKYDEEMKKYIVEKAKYDQSLKDGTPYVPPHQRTASGTDNLDSPKIEETTVEEVNEQSAAPSASQDEKDKKRKKKEKSDKKEKKKKSSN